jgi:cysteine desulfurase/selenocysteine lyase
MEMVSRVKEDGRIDVEKVRQDFPLLGRKVRGKPLAYLDNAATSQKPVQVIEKVDAYLQLYAANVHRAIYGIGEEATEEFEDAREKLRHFINARSPKEVVYTSGTTEAINAIAYGWGLKGHLEKGDEIVTTIMEHHSNTIPWYFLKDLKGVVIKWVDIEDDGTLKMEQYDELITRRTRLVTVTHCSNVLGTINPIEEIVQRAHEVGALCLVDAAQSVPHMPVDVRRLDCDFMAFSGHKMMGPTGIGVLYGKEDILEEMEPFLGGGEMIREVHLGWARWNDLPWKMEAGTPNIMGAIGLGAAADYLSKLDMQRVRQHEMSLTEYALKRLREVPGLKIFGPPIAEDRGGVISFHLEGAHAHDIASILDAEGIAVRAGHHCAQPLMERLKVSATTRASFYVYNTEEEVDRLVAALERVREVFRL